MCVGGGGIDFVSASVIFRLDLGTVPTVWYFLFVFHFIIPMSNVILLDLRSNLWQSNLFRLGFTD